MMCGEYAENSLFTFVENFFREKKNLVPSSHKKKSIDLRNEIKRLLKNIFYIL